MLSFSILGFFFFFNFIRIKASTPTTNRPPKIEHTITTTLLDFLWSSATGFFFFPISEHFLLETAKELTISKPATQSKHLRHAPSIQEVLTVAQWPAGAFSACSYDALLKQGVSCIQVVAITCRECFLVESRVANRASISRMCFSIRKTVTIYIARIHLQNRNTLVNFKCFSSTI